MTKLFFRFARLGRLLRGARRRCLVYPGAECRAAFADHHQGTDHAAEGDADHATDGDHEKNDTASNNKKNDNEKNDNKENESADGEGKL